MSQATSIPYQLRPNKAADRELFLSLLARLSGTLHLENFCYIGLGGPFMEDFRMVHSRIGISDLVCVESDDQVRIRQDYNRPAPCIRCVPNSLEEYVKSTEFDKPVVLWFDFTDPKSTTSQIECYASSALEVPDFSILRLTLNANPESLGKPKADEIQTPPDGIKDLEDPNPTLNEWRLERFRRRMGGLTPNDSRPENMARSTFGKTLLKSVRFAVDRELLQVRNRRIEWLLATHYADGQPMVTATLIVLPNTVSLPMTMSSWPFYTQPDTPLVLDMPMLSSRERLALEASGAPDDFFPFKLPTTGLAADSYASFRQFYRIYPHFAKIDL